MHNVYDIDTLNFNFKNSLVYFQTKQQEQQKKEGASKQNQHE